MRLGSCDDHQVDRSCRAYLSEVCYDDHLEDASVCSVYHTVELPSDRRIPMPMPGDAMTVGI